MANQDKQQKLYGIIEEIVQAVRDKSIDIQHVFSKEFAAEHGYSEDDRQEFFDRLRGNWWESLKYINSVKPEDYAAEFGVFTIADGTEYFGVEVACLVMMNIFAEFPLTGDMFLQDDQTNFVIPNILFNPDDMWEAKTDFAYHTAGDEVIQFTASSNFASEDINAHAKNSKADLMQLYDIIYPFQVNEDEDNPPITKPLGIYGFLASLIYAMFRDAARRKILNSKWFEADLVSMEELTRPNVALYSKDLPVNLCIPSEELNEVYFATALDILQTQYRKFDSRYKKAPEYTIRKMLEIELRQREHLSDSPLWQGFPDKVQQMLLERLDLYIEFLCEQCGIEEPKIEPVKVEQPASEQETRVESVELLPFFVPERFAELNTRDKDEFVKMYHKAVRGEAPELGAFLMRYRDLGVLDLKGKGKKEVFNELQDYFKEELGFGYTNFTLYYKILDEEKS